MDGLTEYAETLEQLLAAEFAATYARVALSDISKRARGHEVIDDEPDEELQALRDDFPSILRGSLFIYVVAAYENQMRAYLNGKYGKNTVGKGDNLRRITATLADLMPTAMDDSARDRFDQYKYLRDACAHTGGQVTSVLHDPSKVSDAAKNIPGVIFRSMADQSDESRTSFSRQQLAAGTVAFNNMFIPEAILFFKNQFGRVAGL